MNHDMHIEVKEEEMHKSQEFLILIYKKNKF